MTDLTDDQISYQILRNLIPPDDIYEMLGMIMRYFSMQQTLDMLGDTPITPIMLKPHLEVQQQLHEMSQIYMEHFIAMKRGERGPS